MASEAQLALDAMVPGLLDVSSPRLQRPLFTSLKREKDKYGDGVRSQPDKSFDI
jgi:hypothetical protein